MQAWINRRCSCVHPDAHECAVIRARRDNNRTAPTLGRFGRRVRVARDDECECVCHDLGEDEQDEKTGRKPG